MKDPKELSSELYQKIVYHWNQTGYNYPKDKTIHQLFEEQVKKTPDNIALVFQDRTITYKELNEKANQLAHYIRSTYKDINGNDFKGDTLIALLLDRSIEMIVAILAVLKSGAAYVPISPELPQQRIDYIFKDTKAQILISQSHLENKFNKLDTGLNIIYADKEYLDYPTVNLNVPITSTNLAYAIYTSGTTGKSKGVMLEHQGIVNRIQWMQSIYPLTEKDRVLQKTPYSFDVSVWELLWANWYGAAIVITKPERHKDCDYLYQEIINKKVTVIHFVPSMLDIFLEYISFNKKQFQKLKVVFCSGEALKLNTVNKFHNFTRDPNIKLYNLYGPTEASIDVSFSLCQLNKKVTIGKPIQNTKLYILDENLKPVSIGFEGELYIGGAGLARGYLNLPELTDKTFISNPFATEKDKQLGYTKLYKTGDLCKWLDNGEIEYIGRNDFQVKVRGFRIELGEIESVISEIKDIQQVYVIVKHRTINSQEQNILVAYYTSDNDLISSELIKDHIKTKLPAYMLPNAFVKLDEVPLTLNGKLDRKALPDPNFSLNKNVATNDLEKKLCKIWSQILDIPENQISTKLSFFDLGGDSLLITRLKNELMSLPECQDLSVTDLFTYNTIDKLSSFLEKEDDDYITPNLQSNNITIDKDIAVIGISGTFSGCSNLDEFWQMLISGERGLTSFDLETCRERGVIEENLQHPDYISTSGHIENIDLFDNGFWNISAHEAKLMDPQIRKFLEHCWLVLEKTGYAPVRSKHNITVIAGNTNSQYFQNNILNCNERDTLDLWEASVLNTKDALATKASHLLGLTGVSESINTACSTGLVTIIEACNKLSNGLCDMAIAGSASLQLPEQTGYIYKEGMILSKDGHCRVFDEKASGTIFGSGVGTVLLKRLSDAQRDKDNIIAVVKGYALNNDGNRKISYTAPSVEGQAECIKQAFNQANISSDEIDYIECHGTGTKLGDPIEVKALSEVFKATSKNQRKQKCILGSAKANIGHIDAAAGLAGFIKLCLMFQHKQIPAQIDYDKPNPGLDLESSPFTIQTQPTEWLSDKTRIAAVSSFGFGGTNSHMIISEYINSQEQEKEVNIREPYILNLSAKSPESLLAYKERFISYLSKTNDSLNSIAYTLQQRREGFDYRLAISCYDKEQAIKKLQSDIKATKCDDLRKRKVIWMFPGQGMQYSKMTYDLYQNDSLYRKTVDQCITIIDKYAKTNFKEILFTENELINQTQWTQPALFIVEYSLAKLLEHMGFEADGYIGHSIGEYVAATLSGVFGLEDAIKIVLKRGELMQKMPRGSMLSISANADTLMTRLIQANNCEISVINSPVQCVASGSYDKILKLSQALDKQGIKSTILNTSHAYHSSMMIEAAQRFKQCFNKIILHRPTKPFISNISGDWIDKDFAIDPEYWATQITATVEFAKGIENSIQSDNSIMLEVGPGHALSTFVQQTKTNNKVTSINLIPSAKNLNLSKVIDSYQDLKAKLWCYGYPVKLQQVKQARIASLPDYCFNSNSYWLYYDKKKKLSLHLLDEKDWLHTCVWQQLGKLIEIENLNTLPNILLIINGHIPDWVKYISAKNLIVVFLCDTLDCFQIFNNNEIGINPKLEENYKNLFNYLQNKEIEYIIDCSILSLNSEFKFSKANEKFSSSFYHLYLLQEHVLKKMAGSLYYISLTQGVAKLHKDDYINPINGSFKSIIRAMSHELPNIKFAMFDIGYNQKKYINFIISEISKGNILFGEHPYAIRDNYLWVETIKPSIKSPNSESLIKDKDVILLTGGLGGIGLVLIEEISKHNSVTFVITTRIKKSASLTNDLFRLLDKRNCYIDLQYGDISELRFTKDLLKYINKKYGKLSGIIHLAGIQPLGEDKTFNEIKGAIKPKVFGINNIINQLSHIANLRYCILTSSFASIMGDVNRIEYCATNGYLDSLSSWLNQRYPKMQTISINWPSWKNTGMAMNQRKVGNIVDLNQIDKSKGAELFYKLIQKSIYHQIIVSKLDINQLKKKIFYNVIKSISLENTTSSILEKDLDKNYHRITSAVLSILGMKQISIHDNLFNLGLNSLDSIQLVNLLNNQGIPISSHELFNLNSIEAIYKYFIINSKKTKNLSVNQKTLIKLKYSSSSKKNVFFIHPVGGILTLYQNLINRLPTQYNYYGIQNINVYEGSKLRFNSLEELSKYYIAEILKIQSCGKFILIGASLGGTIAYEMANQLVKKGKKVQNVIMFDTWADFSPEFNDKKKCEEGILEQFKGQDILKAMKINYKDFINQAWYMMKLNLKYFPKESSLNVILYKANNVEGCYIHNKKSRDNGWQKYISKSIQVYNIKGNHFTLYNGVGLKQINNSLWPILCRQRNFYFKGQRFMALIRKNLEYSYNFVKKKFHTVAYLLLIYIGYSLNEILDGMVMIELL